MTVDQSSAFNCLSHEILIRKLREYNISSTAVKWVQNYLNFRSQYITVGAAKSRMSAMDRGVPQGSVLGPLMYSIFVNELTEVTRDPDCRNSEHENNEKLFGNVCQMCGSIQMYTDDATFSVSSRQRSRNKQRTEKTLEEIENFLIENELHLNVSKTTVLECMIPQKKGKTKGDPLHLEVNISETETKLITDKGSCRILGINFQANMSWICHLESGEKALLPKIRKQLGALRHLGAKIPKGSRRILANSLIISRLAYLVSIWGASTTNQTRRAQVLLNTTARWVTGLRKQTRVRTLMETLGWLTICEMNTLHSCMLMWKMIHHEKPGHLASRIEMEEDLKIKVTETRLQFTQRSFRWKTSIFWNTLPDEVRMETSILKFKKGVKTWIVSRRDATDVADVADAAPD